MIKAFLFGVAVMTVALAFPAASQNVGHRHGATDATREANAKLLDYLPFDDTVDFVNANRGQIAPLPGDVIQTQGGALVWDPNKYDFIEEGSGAPATVNPSLWRQSQLINISGLFEVVPDGIYQIRNLDLSNMTIIEGKDGITVIDPLVSAETAKVGMDLYYANRGKKSVKAVIYTHSHVDHYGGVRGVIDEVDVQSGKVKVYAPDGFMSAAVSENVFAGNAMSRRASYMYGNLLKADKKGQVGAGLGTTTSTGTITLIPPTDIILETGQTETIDGLTYEFLMAPGSEAPSEMLWYVKDYKAIQTAEDATHTLHNTYSLRGAKIREPLPWSKYLNAALQMWGDDAEVVFAQHHWPTWGNENIVELLEKQRDLYRYINDTTLNMVNKGMTMREIAESFDLPDELNRFWANRGYYGSIYHNVAATYVLYLGWFDGNPSTLQELPPVEAAIKFVEYMGGANAIMGKAKKDFDEGNYRWVAQVMNKVVFADPDNQKAKNLTADALEQLGYQAESGPWRNFYLTGAQELRNGVQELPTPDTASPDTVRGMTLDMVFDYAGVRLDSDDAGDAKIKLNFDFGSDGQYMIQLGNGVLNHTKDIQADDADATIILSRNVFNSIILAEVSLADAIKAGDVKINGDATKLKELISYFDSFELWFNIVTP